MSLQQRFGEVVVGGWVKVHDMDTDEEEFFHLVERDNDADVLNNKIPADNPFARALLGSRPGDTISFEAPRGIVRMMVLATGCDLQQATG